MWYTFTMDKNFLEERIKAGVSMHKIAKEVGVGVTTVRYWVGKHGLKIERYSRDIWDADRLRAAAEGATSKREVIRRLGLRDSGSIYTQLDKMAKKFGVTLPEYDWSAGTAARLAATRTPEWIESKFQPGSGAARSTLRRYMLSYFNIEYVCSGCLLDKWLGNEITLQVDHIDGDFKNNVIENLRFLCPNCHSQTETYCRGKI